MRWFWGAICLALAACGGGPVSKGAEDPGAVEAAGPLLRLPPDDPLPPARSNAEMARDVLDLEFQLESGQALPVLTRFDGPIRVTTEGTLPATAQTDAEALMARLRAEAGIDIAFGQPGALVLSFLPTATLRRMEPTAACFVVPNVRGLAEWRRLRGTPSVDWARMTRRTAATIFLPSDAPPQELRDCLHEEMAQALGPVNDLYRLPDSVFNDDNFLSVLTGFDMLMLRVHYAPELANGMTPAEVAARLPALLQRLNPGGAVPGTGDPGPTPKVWTDAVAEATSALPKARRIRAAEVALSLALEGNWQDARAGLAWFLRGRLLASTDPAAAREAFAQAVALYRTLPDGGAHLAHGLMQLAVMDLGAGDPARARAEAAEGLPLALRARNAALIATFQLIQAEALEAEGKSAEARALRLDSLPAARYGFGSGDRMRARASGIAAIAERAPNG